MLAILSVWISICIVFENKILKIFEFYSYGFTLADYIKSPKTETLLLLSEILRHDDTTKTYLMCFEQQNRQMNRKNPLKNILLCKNILLNNSN